MSLEFVVLGFQFVNNLIDHLDMYILPMKKNPVPVRRGIFVSLAIIFSVLFFISSSALAQSLFVVPSAEIPIRRGQGTEYKIVAMVKDGTKVEFLEEEGFYTKVRLGSGKEGWMLSRFLSSDPPLDQVVERLQLENDQLKEKSYSANEKIKELTQALDTTKQELDSLRGEREKLGEDYETLQRDTADVVGIKNELERTTGENSALQDKLAQLEGENRALKKDDKLYWFLAGAGVFLIGIIFGKMPAPSRRRKSSLL